MLGGILKEDIYLNILYILKEHFDKDPQYFVPSSELRIRLNIPVDKLRPYAENLEINGYVYKIEGFLPTFLLKIRKKGIESLKNGKIHLQKECRVYGPDKVKILHILKENYETGNPFFVPKNVILEKVKLTQHDMRIMAEELEYCGLVKKIEGISDGFMLQITKEGLEYLEYNKK